MQLKKWTVLGTCFVFTMMCSLQVMAGDLAGQKDVEIQEGTVLQTSLCDEIEIGEAVCEYEKKEQMHSVIFQLQTSLTNHSAQEVMEIKYQIKFFDKTGAEVFSGWEIYNGQDTPVKPGETVMSECSGRIQIEEKPAFVELEVLEAHSAEEMPPIHLPQEGELLIEAFSDEHMQHIEEDNPIQVEMWIDRGGDLSETTIKDKELIRAVADAFSKIRVGKQTWEVVTDNYNGVAFTFSDGTVVGVHLNLKNLEFPVYHGYQYHELDDFGDFWDIMVELTSKN